MPRADEGTEEDEDRLGGQHQGAHPPGELAQRAVEHGPDPIRLSFTPSRARTSAAVTTEPVATTPPPRPSASAMVTASSSASGRDGTTDTRSAPKTSAAIAPRSGGIGAARRAVAGDDDVVDGRTRAGLEHGAGVLVGEDRHDRRRAGRTRRRQRAHRAGQPCRAGCAQRRRGSSETVARPPAARERSPREPGADHVGVETSFAGPEEQPRPPRWPAPRCRPGVTPCNGTKRSS
jgi:hypothetical protein